MKRFINPTRAAIAALLLSAAGILTACTDSTDLPTDGATTPQAGITSLLPAKPGYTPLPANTRTSTEDGSWQTDDKVTATIEFYSDSEGRQYIPDSQVTQTLTYTATGSWTADPAVVDINPGARSMRVTYAYTGTPDALTKTPEMIIGKATSASGTAVGGNDIDATSTGIIPIKDVTGTLSLKAQFNRLSGLVSVTLQPGQAVEMLLNGDTKVSAEATNTETTPATANFHVTDPAFNSNTFTLRLKDNPEATTCKNVPIQNGWKFIIDARQLNGGAGGGDQQMVTATGMETLDPLVFNGQNNVWMITGGGDLTSDKLVTENVRKAIIALNDKDVTNIDLIMSAVKTVPENGFKFDPNKSSPNLVLRSVSLPAATSIRPSAFSYCVNLTAVVAPMAKIEGSAFYDCKALTTIDVSQATEIGYQAFRNCPALTTIDAPLATKIGNLAFFGCSKLTTLNLPAAKTIEYQAFEKCDALTRLELTAANEITLNANTFLGFNAAANCTLVLHPDKQPGGKGSPKVDGKTWGPLNTSPITWAAILYNGTTLPGVGEGGSGLPK